VGVGVRGAVEVSVVDVVWAAGSAVAGSMSAPSDILDNGGAARRRARYRHILVAQDSHDATM
jgi:hypothetical protein